MSSKKPEHKTLSFTQPMTLAVLKTTGTRLIAFPGGETHRDCMSLTAPHTIQRIRKDKLKVVKETDALGHLTKTPKQIGGITAARKKLVPLTDFAHRARMLPPRPP